MSQNNLKQQIQEDMKTAMRAKDSARLSVIRMLLAAIKQREIDERTVLDQTETLTIIEKMIKQRRDASQQFAAAGRTDLADKENHEITILETYLPQQLSTSEIESIIQEAIRATNASSMQDMGKIMAIIKPQAQGRADLGKISATVKTLLNQ